MHVVALLALALAPPQGVELDLINPAPVARHAAVMASVPFERGRLCLPAAGGPLAVDVHWEGAVGREHDVAPGIPLLRWPDGSIAVLQVAVRAPVAPRATARLCVTPQRDAEGATVLLHPSGHVVPVPSPLPLWTELLDPWGRCYRAELVADAASGPDGLLVDTDRVRVRAFRSPHRLVDGDGKGRPWLDLRAWLVTFAGERRAEFTIVLDNREPTAGPMGPVQIGGFRLCTGSDALRFLPAFAPQNWLAEPRPRQGGGFVQWLLQREGQHWLGDGTAKVWRLHLFADDAAVDQAERDAAAWAPVRAVALADVEAVRRSRAFSAHGGPAPCSNGDLGHAGVQLAVWLQSAEFGPFADWGDPADSTQGGAPRQGDSLLHNVLRWRSAELLTSAEGMVLQHGLRPTGGRALRLPADMVAFRPQLPRAALAMPHGFARFDYEHCSAHLVFDWFWLTGDPLARDELARIGASVRAVLPAVAFRTARGEGNCLLAGTMAARATDDRALLGFLVTHALSATAAAMAPAGAPAALPQPPHPLVFDGQTAFDVPSQMAQLVRGLAALHAATDEPRLLPLIARTADAMAHGAWLEGAGPKSFVSRDDASRYTMAALPEDRSAQDRMVIGALVLAAELAGEPATAAHLHGRADFLLDRELPADAGLPARLSAAANPWLQIAFDRRRTP